MIFWKWFDTFIQTEAYIPVLFNSYIVIVNKYRHTPQQITRLDMFRQERQKKGGERYFNPLAPEFSLKF